MQQVDTSQYVVGCCYLATRQTLSSVYNTLTLHVMLQGCIYAQVPTLYSRLLQAHIYGKTWQNSDAIASAHPVRSGKASLSSAFAPWCLPAAGGWPGLLPA